MKPRLLILCGYDEAGREALARADVKHPASLYERMLRGFSPEAQIESVELSGGRFELPPNAALDDFDGIGWTGSNLTVHEDVPAVRTQLDLARRAFELGIPSFGSCWGLQIAVTAAGGRCAPSPLGREFGIGRKVVLSDEGRAHPMFAHKPGAFDVFTSHEDCVIDDSPDMVVLASNAHSRVQAAVVRHDRGEFWAVQYHPEYAPTDIARLGRVRGPQLVRQGDFESDADAERTWRDLEELDHDRSTRHLRYRLGVGDDLLDDHARQTEVANWLAGPVADQVLARAAGTLARRHPRTLRGRSPNRQHRRKR